MHLYDKLLLLACFVLTVVITIVQKPTSTLQVILIGISSTALLFGILRWVHAARLIRHDVAQQARKQHKSSWQIWISLLNKAVLYIFVPALLITFLMMVIAYTVVGQ